VVSGACAVKEIRVSLSVTSSDPTVITQAGEVLHRTQVGLALEGMDTFLMIGTDDDEEE